MTNKSTSYSENGEKVVSLYNFARLHGENKLNKKEALDYVSEKMKLSKAEVGRILKYGQENGDFVFSNKGYRELIKDEVYRVARSGIDIETIANSYGISKSTARKYSHPTFEVAEAEVINDPNATPIKIVSRSYGAKPSQVVRTIGASLEKAESSIVNGLSRAYEAVTDGFESGLNALSAVGNQFIRNASKEQRFSFAKEPRLAFASLGAASADDPVFKNSSVEEARAKTMAPKEDSGVIGTLADLLVKAESAMGRGYQSAAASLKDAGSRAYSWLGRNARAAGLSAALIATAVVGSYGLSSFVNSYDSGKAEPRKAAIVKTDNASAVKATKETFSAPELPIADSAQAKQAKAQTNAVTKKASLEALTLPNPELDLTSLVNSANTSEVKTEMPQVGYTQVEVPGIPESVFTERTNIAPDYESPVIAKQDNSAPTNVYEDQPVLSIRETEKNRVIADVLNGATNDNVAALKAYLRTNPKDEGTAKLFKSAVKELKRSGNYNRREFNRAYKTTVETENLAPEMVSRFKYHLGNIVAKVTPIRDAGRMIYQRDVENADTMNKDDKSLFENEFVPAQFERAKNLGIFTQESVVDESNLRRLISNQMKDGKRVSLDDVITTNFVIDSNKELKKKYGSMYNNFAAGKFAEFAMGSNDDELKSVALFNAEVLSIRNPELFKMIRKMRESYRWDVNELVANNAGEVYPTSVILRQDLLDAQDTHRRNIAGTILKTAADVAAVKAVTGSGSAGGSSGGSSGGSGAGGAGGPAPHDW